MKKITGYLRYWLKMPASWKKCTRASCWDGANAGRRMMNILSPKFSGAKFKEYVKWMLGRGCDTAHVILLNKGDGEGAGYDAGDDPKLSQRRIKYLVTHGLAVVPWLVTDDSAAWAKKLFADPAGYIGKWYRAGLFDYASFVCLGLEMNEYGKTADWNRVRAALKAVYRGKVATHHTSGVYPFANLGEIVCDQLDPKAATPAKIKSSVTALRATGKAVVGFEYERHADRDKAQAALDAGAFGVGNW